jgi:hypothetical protein
MASDRPKGPTMQETSRKRPYVHWTPELDYAIKRMDAVGMSYGAMAKALLVYESEETSPRAIRNRLERLGIPRERRDRGRPFTADDNRRRHRGRPQRV